MPLPIYLYIYTYLFIYSLYIYILYIFVYRRRRICLHMQYRCVLTWGVSTCPCEHMVTQTCRRNYRYSLPWLDIRGFRCTYTVSWVKHKRVGLHVGRLSTTWSVRIDCTSMQGRWGVWTMMSATYSHFAPTAHCVDKSLSATVHSFTVEAVRCTSIALKFSEKQTVVLPLLEHNVRSRMAVAWGLRLQRTRAS